MEGALWHIQKGREHVHTAQTYFKLIKLQYEAWGENCEKKWEEGIREKYNEKYSL